MNKGLRNTLPFLLGVICLLGLGCKEPPQDEANVEQDVRGLYAPVYHDTLVIKLHIGDTVRAAKPSAYEGYVEFGTLDGELLIFDLGEFCARTDIVCSGEILGGGASIDQLDAGLRLGSHGLRVTPDDTSSGPALLEGVVDHNAYDAFILDASALGEGGECDTQGSSTIRGRFTHTYETEDQGVITWASGEKVDGIAKGRVFLSFPGSCAFGPLGESFEMTMEHEFIAYRIGDLSTTGTSDAGTSEADAVALDSDPTEDGGTKVSDGAAPADATTTTDVAAPPTDTPPAMMDAGTPSN